MTYLFGDRNDELHILMTVLNVLAGFPLYYSYYKMIDRGLKSHLTDMVRIDVLPSLPLLVLFVMTICLENQMIANQHTLAHPVPPIPVWTFKGGPNLDPRSGCALVCQVLHRIRTRKSELAHFCIHAMLKKTSGINEVGSNYQPRKPVSLCLHE